MEISEEIARFFKEPVGKMQVIVDEFGERYTARAFESVQLDMAKNDIRNPLGLMISKLRSGEVQALLEIEDAEDRVAAVEAGRLQERYEAAQRMGVSAACRLAAKIEDDMLERRREAHAQKEATA